MPGVTKPQPGLAKSIDSSPSLLPRARPRIVGALPTLYWEIDHEREHEHDYDIGNASLTRHRSRVTRPYFFTAIDAEYCVSSHISFNTPSAIVFSTVIMN